MTAIVGMIRDVHLAGASGTLTIWSGFRPTTTSVVAPKRTTWDVHLGVLPAGIDVGPGPAIIQLDFGPAAYKSWPVEVPDELEISIQELLFQSLPWGPEVPLPPSEEVTDLLRLIADTAEQYRVSLGADIDAALASIGLALTDVQQGVTIGQGHSVAAQEYMEAALDYATNALIHSQTAANLANDAEGLLTATQAIRDQADAVAAQIAVMQAAIDAKADAVNQDAAAGQAAADAAAQDAADAAADAAASQSLNEQMALHLQNAQAAVAEGERQVGRALAKADEAMAAAANAATSAADAVALVADAGVVLDSTEAARDAAQSALATIQGVGTSVDLIQTQVLTLHDEILTKHGEILAAHGTAIDAAAAAAASAGEAAGLATETATSAALAADQALEATEQNAEAQATFATQQEQFNEDYSQRVLLQEMMLEAVREAQASSLFQRWYILTAHLDQYSIDDYVTIHAGVTDVKVTAKGDWVGRMIVQAGFLSSSGTGVDQRDAPIPQANGSRVVTFSRPNSDGGRIWARVDYSVDPATQESKTTYDSNITSGMGAWKELTAHRYTAVEGGSKYAISFQIGWDHANFLDSFYHRIRVIGGPVLAEYSQYNIGPVFGSAYRSRTITASGVDLSPGDIVVFEAGTSGTATNSEIGNSRVKTTWVQEAG